MKPSIIEWKRSNYTKLILYGGHAMKQIDWQGVEPIGMQTQYNVLKCELQNTVGLQNMICWIILSL